MSAQKYSIRKRAPRASSPTVRRAMTAIPGRNTKPEVKLYGALRVLGVRCRRNTRPERDLRIEADFVFRPEKVCIFVDGCFWHGCPKHFSPPKTHTSWWYEKIQDNRERDKRKTLQLRRLGWKVMRVWEHDLAQRSLRLVIRRVKAAIRYES